MKKNLIIVTIIVTIVLVFDQVLKIYIKSNFSPGETHPLIGDWFVLEYIENQGMAFGTNDTGRSFNMMEDGSDTLSREEVAQLASRQEKFIASLKNALMRIENKTYGICRVTGKLIKKERLKLVPHATLSIEAKNAQS